MLSGLGNGQWGSSEHFTSVTRCLLDQHSSFWKPAGDHEGDILKHLGRYSGLLCFNCADILPFQMLLEGALTPGHVDKIVGPLWLSPVVPDRITCQCYSPGCRQVLPSLPNTEKTSAWYLTPCTRTMSDPTQVPVNTGWFNSLNAWSSDAECSECWCVW